MSTLTVKPRSNAIFTPESYPTRNPALPLARVVTTACESVPRKRRQIEALRAKLDGEWLLRVEGYSHPRDLITYSVFN